MSRIHEEATERFVRWEKRTRGHLVYPHPVALEPPFVPFFRFPPSSSPPEDDGRRPTVLSSLFQHLWQRPTPLPSDEADQEPEPAKLERQARIELPLYLPESFDARRPQFEAFIRSLFVCQHPIALELVGTAGHVTAQLATSPEDFGHVRQLLRAFFPELVSTPVSGGLETAWNAAGQIGGVVEFGLAKECVLPLASPDHDPYVALVGVLNELAPSECAIFQVMWRHVENDWAESLVQSVTDSDGRPFFVNAPELTGAAKAKTAQPLYAAVVRLAACSPEFDRTWEILRLLAGGLRAFAHPAGNELIPLRNDEYPFETHVADVLSRQSRRAGMILNAEELVGFAHLPSSAVRSGRFRRQIRKTKPAPAIAVNAAGLLLGENEHAGEKREVRLYREQRRKHLYVIGASGTGKTTLLFNLIRQDIEAGEGLAVLDPHGDLIDRILGCIPPERIDDVVLLDPSDEEFSVGFNILSAHSDLEKNLLASDLVSVFQRLSTSWGDQMGVVLNNAIRAFLESTRGGTLSDLRRFLLEPAFRERFLSTVGDPDIVYYWRKSFAQLAGNKSIGPVVTRLETFLGPKPIRYLVSQAENRLDFADIMDGGKIFLAKLSQGAIGKENSYLLGSLLMAKFQQIAMGRQGQAEEARRDFWLYLDEFHNFITPSTAEILSGARKYRIGLSLAHQELRQLERDREVASAVLSNPYTRVCFRVGDQDARTLEHGFSSFQARDLQNLGTGEAVCRVERSDYDFNLTVALPELPDEAKAAIRRREVIAASRAKYATPRATVERAFQERAEAEAELPPKAVKAESEPARKPKQPVEPATPVNEPAINPASLVSRPARAEPKLSALSTDPGRGGIQHKAIQKRLKEAAEALGFRASTEHVILDGAGGVDLALERADLRIACEVTITTSIDHEVGNVAKCVKAGFGRIAMIAVSEDKLKKLAAAVEASLGEAAAGRVGYFLPEDFLAHLKALPHPPPPMPTEKAVRGWKVKTSYRAASPDEARAKEDAMLKLIAETMRRKPG